jgi:transposase InsO family protein
MDMIVDLPSIDGFDSVLVVVDRFTKLSHFLPCSKTMTSFDLADLFVREIFRLHGLPSDIVSDRGSIFVSQFWTALMKTLKIDQKLSSAYHPQTDGQTERVNQVLEQYLRCYADYNQTNWTKNLSLAEYTYNSSLHSSTKMSPFFAMYGYDPPLDLSCELTPELPPTTSEYVASLQETHEVIKEELKLAQDDAKKFADRKRSPHEFKEGDLVYLNRKNIKTTRPSLKLDWKQFGPFKISKKINSVAYRLDLPPSMKRLHDVFHISLLSLAKTCDIPGRKVEPPPPVHFEAEEEYEVSEILDCRRKKNHLEYLVSWSGYGPSDNTWEPSAHLTHCADLVEDFHSRFPNKPKNAPRRGKMLGHNSALAQSGSEEHVMNRDLHPSMESPVPNLSS